MPNELKDMNNNGYSGGAGGGYGYGGGGGGSGGSGQYNNQGSGGYTGYGRIGQPGGYSTPGGAPRTGGIARFNPVYGPPPRPPSVTPVGAPPQPSPFGIHGWGATMPGGTLTAPYDTGANPGGTQYGPPQPSPPSGYGIDPGEKDNYGGPPGMGVQGNRTMAPQTNVAQRSAVNPMLVRALMGTASRGPLGGFGK